MEITENKVEYNISAHAKQRYAERIMGKDDTVEINRFITLNEDKIKTDINKMIEYGELIYRGKSAAKNSKGNMLDVYLQNCWVVLVDKSSEVVVTLYKIDLELGDEFNKTYISKMLEKLNVSKAKLEEVKLQVYNETNMYSEMLHDAETQIKEYRGMIKNLEGLCDGYKDIIDNNIVKETQASREVAEVINTLISKKEF
jgi:hypothetical protein